MSRALRRHHQQRMKARYRRKERLHPYWRSDDPASAGKYANHGCTCSCWMCGNPRRHLNELTMQERRAMAAPDDTTEPSTADDYIEQGEAEEIEDYLYEVEMSLLED